MTSCVDKYLSPIPHEKQTGCLTNSAVPEPSVSTSFPPPNSTNTGCLINSGVPESSVSTSFPPPISTNTGCLTNSAVPEPSVSTSFPPPNSTNSCTKTDIGTMTDPELQQSFPLSDGPDRSYKSNWRYLSKRREVSDTEFHRITGVNKENFEVLYEFLGGDIVCDNLKYAYGAATPKKKKGKRKNATNEPSAEEVSASKTSETVTSRDKLFLTLVRMRRGFCVEDMALIFGLSKSWVSIIFNTWVQFMYLQFKRIQVQMCVTRHDQPSWKIAPCFLAYKNFRMVLDTTEIRIQTPYHYRQQGNTYSSYKAGNVILYMIGMSGFGSVCFISPGFEGSMSDKKIFAQSGLPELLERGDLLVVDRGFLVKDIADKIGVTVVHPPFTKKGQPLCPEDNMLTKRIGSDRSHVERIIRKIKCFNILKKITNSMLPILDQLVYVCGCMVNFDADLLLEK